MSLSENSVLRIAGFALASLLAGSSLDVPAQDVRAIQIREAQKADERTLAYLARFRAALIEKFGGDPLLSMLVVTENEGKALVHAQPAGPAQFVIFQEGKWHPTDGRELKPWAPAADPAAARFPLSRRERRLRSRAIPCASRAARARHRHAERRSRSATSASRSSVLILE